MHTRSRSPTKSKSILRVTRDQREKHIRVRDRNEANKVFQRRPSFTQQFSFSINDSSEYVRLSFCLSINVEPPSIVRFLFENCAAAIKRRQERRASFQFHPKAFRSPETGRPSLQEQRKIQSFSLSQPLRLHPIFSRSSRLSFSHDVLEFSSTFAQH